MKSMCDSRVCFKYHRLIQHSFFVVVLMLMLPVPPSHARWAEVEARQRVRLRVRKCLREFLKSRGAPFALGALEKQQKEDRYDPTAVRNLKAHNAYKLFRQSKCAVFRL